MAKKETVELSWHPNYRDASTLPDIKPVRSAFFINFGTMAVALILLGYWIFVEVQISTINAWIKADKKQISNLKASNDELLKQSQEFEKMAKIIGEIQGFIGTPFKPSGYLVAIGEMRTEGMTLSQMSYTIEPREESTPSPKKGQKPKVDKYTVCNITVSGSINGTAPQATRSIERLLENLEKAQIFEGLKFVKKPQIKTFERDKGLEVYTFAIVTEVKI